jgi:hypothetical protein
MDPITQEETKEQKLFCLKRTELSLPLKIQKQLFIYKGSSFDLNEVYGVENKET